MKQPAVKSFLLLSVPAVLLLGFGLTRPHKPSLRLQSVHIKPVPPSQVIFNVKGVTGVELFIEHENHSPVSRLTEEYALFIDPQQGMYIQDERGNKYGYSSTAQDRTKWHRLPMRMEGIDESPYNLRALMTLDKIPKSAGKLTLKTTLNLHKDYPSEPLARLPISIVVRQ